MTSITILSLDNQDIQTDARVLRQIEALGKDNCVHVVAFGQPNQAIPHLVESLQIVGSLKDPAGGRRLRTLGLLSLGRLFPGWAYPRWYWGRPGHRCALEALLEIRPDIIHANDWWSLPVAVEAARQTGAKVVADLHEYALDELGEQLWWRWLYAPVVAFFLRQAVPVCSASITVNQMIADQYHKIFGINPVVVMNAPKYQPDIQFRPCASGKVHLVHHGVALRMRHLERLIEMVAVLDERFILHFMLLGDEGYIQELKRMAQETAAGRVVFEQPVSPAHIVQALNRYDIGIFLMPAKTFQTQAVLPNKFFDFIAAGLGLCVSSQPEMARLVNQYQIGIVVPFDQPQEAVRMLSELSKSQIDRMKRNAIIARQELNADKEMEKLLGLYRSL